jgi:hypothetical protein
MPFEYDQVNIVCPVYAPGTHESDAEKYIIYNVSVLILLYARYQYVTVIVSVADVDRSRRGPCAIVVSLHVYQPRYAFAANRPRERFVQPVARCSLEKHVERVLNIFKYYYDFDRGRKKIHAFRARRKWSPPLGAADKYGVLDRRNFSSSSVRTTYVTVVDCRSFDVSDSRTLFALRPLTLAREARHASADWWMWH